MVSTLGPPNRPFSIALLPDTQNYTSCKRAVCLAMFTAQTRWVVEHREELNIAFVMHGGYYLDGKDYPEWQRAEDSLSLLDGLVPYALAVGNHDGLMTG